MAYSGVYVKPNQDLFNALPFLDLATQSKPRVLVFGSREWYSYDLIRRDMWFLREKIGPYTLVEGEAPGADTCAKLFANTQGWEVDPFHANWKKYNLGAGPIRNQKMLDSGVDFAMGYILNESKGSQDMLLRLQGREIPRRITRMAVSLNHGFPEI